MCKSTALTQQAFIYRPLHRLLLADPAYADMQDHAAAMLLVSSQSSREGIHCRQPCTGHHWFQWFHTLQTHVQEEAELFGLEVPPQLREPWALTTPALAKIDEDASWLLSSTAQVLSETLGLPASLCTHTACLRVSTRYLPQSSHRVEQIHISHSPCFLSFKPSRQRLLSLACSMARRSGRCRTESIGSRGPSLALSAAIACTLLQ